MIDYAAVSTYCATWRFWTGQRQADPVEKRVVTPRHATIGTCDCPTGHWRGRLKPGNSSCRHFARWEELR